MKKANMAVGAMLLGGLLLYCGSLGRGQQQAPPKNGGTLEEVGRSIKEGLQNARDAMREEFVKARQAVHDMGVMSRVYGRLHWDKALNTSELDVKVQGGVVALRGTVPGHEARNKAVTLAGDTVGVTKVIDELTVLVESHHAPAPAWPPARP
jgi:osmotically-inducible protein OsmY